MAVDHLSLYQLTIEPGTRFGDLAARGRLRGLPAAEAAAEMFLATQEVCEAAGLAAYETSNHARPGREGRHNLVYWRYGDYAGVGPGAHGRLTVGGTRWATEAIRAPEAWLAAVEAGQGGSAARAPVAPAEQAVEMAMMGLRLAEGIDLGRYAALAGAAMADGADRRSSPASGSSPATATGCGRRRPAGRCSTRCCGGCSPSATAAGRGRRAPRASSSGCGARRPARPGGGRS